MQIENKALRFLVHWPPTSLIPWCRQGKAVASHAPSLAREKETFLILGDPSRLCNRAACEKPSLLLAAGI